MVIFLRYYIVGMFALGLSHSLLTRLPSRSSGLEIVVNKHKKRITSGVARAFLFLARFFWEEV